MIEILQKVQLLQSIDLQIGECETRLAQIPPEIERLEQKVNDRAKVLENKANELEEQRKMQRKLDNDLQDNEEKLVKFNTQLNQIKSNDDYRAMLKQIETIKYQNSEIESAILETYEEIDALKKEQVELKKALESFRTEIQQAIDLLRSEDKQVRDKCTELVEEQQSVRKEIDPPVLSHYDKLISSKLSPALVPILNERCGGCHMVIRPKILIDIRRNDTINYCENCTRYLFWKAPAEEEKPA
ncbi:hypothetical protein JXQ70_14060 [bacterium]|nr:hypothetical protein [bacterium]